MMLKREALCILDQVYVFCRDSRHTYCKIPTKVIKELVQVRSILPLLRCSVYTEWYPIVHASDASPFGIGICSSEFGAHTAGNIGRVSERWRFKLDNHISARRLALGIDGTVSDKGVIDRLSNDEINSLGVAADLIIPSKLFLSPH